MTSRKQPLQGALLAMAILSKTHPINFVLTVSVCGHFTLAELQTAVNHACQKHPTLTSLVTYQENGQAFLIPNAAPYFPVEEQQGDKWHNIATAELVRPFDLTAAPPVRFVLLRHDANHADIVVVCAHALADGLSAAYLIHDLLLVLGNDSTVLTPKAALPPFNELIPDYQGKRRAILLAKLKAPLAKLFVKLMSFKSNTQSPALGNYHLLTWRLSTEQSTALLTRCRAEKTTVHAALCVAFLRAFGELHQDGWQRRIQGPVNIRPRLAQPVTDDFGMFINLIEFEVSCSLARDYWDVARDVRQGFVQRMRDANLFNIMIDAQIIIEAISDSLQPAAMMQSAPAANYDLSITNLGRLKMPEPTNKLQLEALYGPCVAGNPDEVVLGVNSVNGRLHFSLLFLESKMSLVQGERIQNDAMGWMAEAIA